MSSRLSFLSAHGPTPPPARREAVNCDAARLHQSVSPHIAMFFRPGLLRAAKLPTANARLFAASTRRFYSSRSRFRPPVGPPAGQKASENWLIAILGLNTVVFAAWKYADNTIPIKFTEDQLEKIRVYRGLIDNFVFKPEDPQHGRWWTAITHAFSHKDLPHFIFNMIALKSFGEALIAYLPGIRPLTFPTLYLGASLSGSLGWYLQKRTDTSESRSAGALGASGAVSGLAAACALIAPNAKWGFVFLPIGIPAWAMFSAYIAYDAFYLNDPNSRIGHGSHLSGAAFGAVYYLMVLRRFQFPLRR